MVNYQELCKRDRGCTLKNQSISIYKSQEKNPFWLISLQWQQSEKDQNFKHGLFQSPKILISYRTFVRYFACTYFVSLPFWILYQGTALGILFTIPFNTFHDALWKPAFFVYLNANLRHFVNIILLINFTRFLGFYIHNGRCRCIWFCKRKWKRCWVFIMTAANRGKMQEINRLVNILKNRRQPFLREL